MKNREWHKRRVYGADTLRGVQVTHGWDETVAPHDNGVVYTLCGRWCAPWHTAGNASGIRVSCPECLRVMWIERRIVTLLLKGGCGGND